MDPKANVSTALLARRAQLTEDANKKMQELEDIEKQGKELDELIRREGEANSKKKRKYNQFLKERRHFDGTIKPAYLLSELEMVITHVTDTRYTFTRKLHWYRTLSNHVRGLVDAASNKTKLLPFHLFTEAEVDSLDILHKLIDVDKNCPDGNVFNHFEECLRDIVAMKNKIQDLK